MQVVLPWISLRLPFESFDIGLDGLEFAVYTGDQGFLV
jgi:hypothetical protein